MGPDKQNNEPVAQAEPVVVAAEAEAVEVPAIPVKKSKKGLIIGLASAGVVLGLLTGGLVYAFVYNSPENVVIDAFSKLLVVKSGSTTGTASMKSDGSTFKMNWSSALNESQKMSLDSDLTMTTDGKDYTIKGHFAGTKDEFYVKLDDLRSVIKKAFGEEYSSMIDTYYGSLLDKIDNKWVVIKQSDLDSMSGGSVNSKETQCVEDEMAKIKSDATLRNELINVYRKNPLFTVEAQGSDSNGNKYKLTPVSKEKAKDFFTAAANTKLFKALDDCTSDDLKRSLTEDEKDATSEKATGSLTIWIDGWSHSLNKASLSIKDSTNEFSSDITMKYDNPSVTLPKGQTTIDELKSDIQNLGKQFTSTYETDYSEYGSDYSY